ncbi:hypothetical protein CD178_01275 [Komagataeibacter saccharivorans]|uniref:Uncharacterized protein n=1 Tax=Komagataeibacter saccharivorans TaxID=265959 RepID=A0A347WB15_9PROT|nr:hypothetical protein CD178_01275 [Komagataeibacter saccharivorans]
MHCQWMNTHGLASLLWPRRRGCYQRVSLWFRPDMAWMERPRPLDI